MTARLFSPKAIYLTKNRSDSLTRLYRLDYPKPGEVNILKLSVEFDVRGEVTAADALPDGKRLLLLTCGAVWLLEAATENGDDWFSRAA